VLIFAYGLLRLFDGARLEFGGGDQIGWLLGRTAKRLQRLPGLRRKFFLGVALGFLPCMITFWALGLAASTQSPLHGAILMVLLVWMTSLVIFGIGLAPALLPVKARRFRERLLSVFLVFSGVWLGLISAAANGWIEHAGVGFSAAGRGFAVMFW
jgi:sulfite exporter TauE/SafE